MHPTGVPTFKNNNKKEETISLFGQTDDRFNQKKSLVWILFDIFLSENGPNK